MQKVAWQHSYSYNDTRHYEVQILYKSLGMRRNTKQFNVETMLIAPDCLDIGMAGRKMFSMQSTLLCTDVIV